MDDARAVAYARAIAANPEKFGNICRLIGLQSVHADIRAKNARFGASGKALSQLFLIALALSYPIAARLPSSGGKMTRRKALTTLGLGTVLVGAGRMADAETTGEGIRRAGEQLDIVRRSKEFRKLPEEVKMLFPQVEAFELNPEKSLHIRNAADMCGEVKMAAFETAGQLKETALLAAWLKVIPVAAALGLKNVSMLCKKFPLEKSAEKIGKVRIGRRAFVAAAAGNLVAGLKVSRDNLHKIECYNFGKPVVKELEKLHRLVDRREPLI